METNCTICNQLTFFDTQAKLDTGICGKCARIRQGTIRITDLQAISDVLEERLEAVEADISRPGVAGWAKDYWSGQQFELRFTLELLIPLLLEKENPNS